MIDQAMWDKTMALLDARDAQCNQLIDIVKGRDAYLEKAVALIEGRDARIARLQQETASLSKLLKSVADDPSLLKRSEYQTLISQLPSTH